MSLKPKYLQSRLKLLDDVCNSGFQALAAYFVWFCGYCIFYTRIIEIDGMLVLVSVVLYN
jgi:hypothetical protein